MVTLEKLALYALYSDDFNLRVLTDEFLRANPDLSVVERPDTQDEEVLALSASLVELFARRYAQNPPSWAVSIGGLNKPRFLSNCALRSRSERQRCLELAPEALKKRNFYALENYLQRV